MSSALLSAPTTPPAPGSTYKLVVRSAAEAVSAIREQLGEHARVLSVRQLPTSGLSGLFGRPRLEVIAQLPALDRSASVRPATEPSLSAPTVAASESSAGPVLPTPVTATPRTAYLTATPAFAAVATEATGDRVSLRTSEPAPRLPDLLRRSGFSSAIIGRLEGTSVFAGTERKALHHSLADIGATLRAAAGRRPFRPLPARAAFLGTPGVGRTTALCKWLAREVFTHARTGRVLKAEFDRPNPAEGLAVFCEALGLNLEHVTAESPVEPRSADFVYVDMPGLSVRHPGENREQRRFLDTEKIEGRVLVLNAAYDLATLRDAYAAGRDMGATHLVFTHLDELAHWGKLWDFLIEGELYPLFLSTGAGLTGDLEMDVSGAVLQRTLPGSQAPHLS